MNKKLYALMDWAKIEEVVYGECDRPADFLGAHAAGRQTLAWKAFVRTKSPKFSLWMKTLS